MTLFPHSAFGVMAAKMREEDKRQHMVWSFWLTFGALLVVKAPAAFGVVMLIGLLKECWDARYGSGFCCFDLCANLIGSLGALAVALPACWIVGLA